MRVIYADDRFCRRLKGVFANTEKETWNIKLSRTDFSVLISPKWDVMMSCLGVKRTEYVPFATLIDLDR